MADADIVAAGVCRLAKCFKSQQLTPTDAVSCYLSRIDRLNPAINAFIFVDKEAALQAAQASAERWQSGIPLSDYDGVPIALKANIAVSGRPWHAGIEAYKNRPATTNATIVDRLQGAGFIILGLTNMDEGGLGAAADNTWLGRCCNPIDSRRSPGGSSGGSAAAVAAGLCAAALGSDTMGSIRIPAAYCGIGAHKPSDGVVSTDGLLPLSTRYDTLGALARSIGDVAAMQSVISTDDPESGPIAGLGSTAVGNANLRLARFDYLSNVESDLAVQDLYERAARKLGQQVGDIPLIQWPSIDIGRLRRRLLLFVEIQAQQVHAETLQASPELFSPQFRALMAFGESKASARDQIDEELLIAGNKIRDALQGFDAVVMPATPQPAFTFGDAIPDNQADFCVLANLAGLPATVTPIGVSRDGLPIALQIMSQRGQDLKSLMLAHAVEQIHS